jgi:hypothetical protein
MTFQMPALPVGIETDVTDVTDVTDAAAAERAARRRKRIEAGLTVMATIVAVLVISTANVALDLIR